TRRDACWRQWVVGELKVIEDADGPVDPVSVLEPPRQVSVARLVAGRLADLLRLQDLNGQRVGRGPRRDGKVAGEDEARRELLGVQREVADVCIDAIGVALQRCLLTCC